MPPKKGGGKSSANYKAGSQIKDIVPASQKNPPRDGKPLKQVEAVQQIPQEKIFEDFQEVEEWPGDETAQGFDFQVNGTTVFSEENSVSKEYLKIKNKEENIVFWRRPVDYIKDEEEQKGEINQQIQLRRRQSYNTQNDFVYGKQNSKDERFPNFKDDTEAYRKNKQDFIGQYVEENEEGEQEQQQQQQQQQQQEEETNEPLVIKMCNIFEREETQEEMEQRIKEQEQKAQDNKKGKKAAKKQEEHNDGPMKIKDCKLSNIDMSYTLIDDCKWIASQLQLIKDRGVKDVNTNKPIWSKIYPQENGVPIYNQSGRYWVKLYFQGKERKIEVDDKMPVNVRNECYFPKSVKKDEIWASILSKALLKLITLTSNISKENVLTGSGLIMYALTGMLSETVPINPNDEQFNENTFQFIKNMLSDENYNNSDVFMSIYCNPDYIPRAESNIKRDIKEYYIDKIRDGYNSNLPELGSDDEQDKISSFNQQQQETEEEKSFSQSPSNAKKQRKSIDYNNMILQTFDSPSKFAQRLFNRKASLREKPTYVIPGFAYSITEGFLNYSFNMVYVQKRSDKEVKLRQEYFDISKVTMHKFNKDEKLEHRRKKKELREKISECDRARVELITKPPIQYKLFRLKTNASKCPQLNIQCPFSNEEIQIAQTCILNHMTKPPNYELPEVRDDGKSMISTVKNQEESFVMKPLDDFSSISHLKKPLKRGTGGNWVKHTDLSGCFQYFQIFYNPKKLKNSQDIFIKSNPDQDLTSNSENELLIINRKVNEEGDELDEDIKLIVGFQPNNAKGQELQPQPFCILQKFDFAVFDTVHNYTPLRQKEQSQFIELENQNNLFKLMTYSPLSYMLHIACDTEFSTTSIHQYLMDYEDYKLKQFSIDYPSFEENKYMNLGRFRIQPFEEENTLLLKINSTTDNNMLKYFRFKILEEPKQGGYMLDTTEGVHKNMYEKVVYCQEYVRLTLKPNSRYHILLEGYPPYNVQEGAIEYNFYVKNEEQVLEQVELVEPVEYVDRYNPTKYGILFREKLYSLDEQIGSIFLRIAQSQGGAAQQAQPDKKGGKKGGDQGEIAEKPLEEKRLIKLELFEGDKLIQYSYGYNQVLLSNIQLKGNKDESISYYLQGTFDLRDWEGCKVIEEYTQSIIWNLKIQSSDTLVFIKDTLKEDREKAIVSSWEEQEQGRAVKAKSARQKFLLYQKQQQGEELSEEEQAILNEPRLTRKQREEEQAGGKGGAKKGAKKDDKKGPKKGAKGAQEEPEVKEQRPVPESINHRMNQIRYFLQHMEADRVMEVLAKHQGLIDVRSDENKEEIEEKAKMTYEDLEGRLKQFNLLREELTAQQNDKRENLLKNIDENKQEFLNKWDEYVSTRESIKTQMSEKTLKEKEIQDICAQEKPVITSENFEKILEEAKQIPQINEKLIDLAYIVLKNIKIFALSEKFTNALAIFDVETLKQCMQEFKEFSVTGIDSSIIEQSDAMIQEAADNPNFQAEKAAELKKAGKKGKK